MKRMMMMYQLPEEEMNDDEEIMDEEEEDGVPKELYKDVNVNLRTKDAEMTDADQGGPKQQNVSQVSGFEQVEEDSYVIFTSVLDAQKADDPVQSSSVSSDFTSRLLNLDNTPPCLDETSSQTSSLFTVPIVISRTNLEKLLTKPFLHITWIVDKKLKMRRINIALVDTSMRTIIREEVTSQLPQILPQAVLNFMTLVIEKNVAEYLENVVMTRSSSQTQSMYEATAALTEFELTKILIDKMEQNKSFDKHDHKREIYNALRGRDDKDKDQDPSARSELGSKTRKLSKNAESSRDSRSKGKKSPMQHDQEFVTGDNDKQPADKEVTKADWFKKPERPLTPDPDWNKRQQVDFQPPQT
ncbi:hypothetical protein Tco_0778459 [Tanacetum coccineum]